MNYKKQYDLLMKKRKEVPITEGYFETHHIIPKCLGGEDTEENLVRLTYREHFLAHEFLYKHYRTSKLAHAWFCMLMTSSNQQRIFTSRQYEAAKHAHVSTLKVTMRGNGNNFYGKKHSDETKLKISEKVKEHQKKVGKTQEQIQNWIEKVASKPASQKQKETMSRMSKNKIMLKNIHTGEVVKVDKSKKNEYDANIWKNPAAISQRRESCIHCGKTSVVGNIKRWHNDNCKHKLNLS